MKKIILNPEDLEKCREFSELVDTSFYETRNQFDILKRKGDTLIGKAGELIAYYNLIEKYPDLTYPDFKIYKAKEKSWDYDLKTQAFNLHVKTARSNSNFPESWIFQNQDKHIFNNHLDNDYVVFVRVNILEKCGLIRNILPVKLLHETKLFKKPMLAKLFDKSAIYFDDIEKIEMHLIGE